VGAAASGDGTAGAGSLAGTLLATLATLDNDLAIGDIRRWSP
jgi:hypothetical protein